MSDHDIFSLQSPNAASLALALMFSKLLDLLISSGTISRYEASSMVGQAIGEIDLNKANVADKDAFAIMKKFQERLARD
jgi:hypothetical protein